jgi:hypothetical protein
MDAKRNALDAFTVKPNLKVDSADCRGVRHKLSSGEERMQQVVDFMVELSGIEPLASSLRIQGSTSDGEMPDDIE